MSVWLAEVNSANYMAVLSLQVKEHRESFVASNAVSLAEAYVYDKNGESMFSFVVYDDEELTGAATDLWTSYEIENQHARQYYQAFGFKEIGEVVDGELVALYPLTHY